MLGFDALGKFALGPPSVTFTMSASLGTYSVTGIAAVFRASELSSVGTFSVSGNASLFSVKLTSAAGSYVVTGNAIGFGPSLVAGSGSYTVTANDADLVRDFVNWLPSSGLTGTWSAGALPSSAWTPAAEPSTTWTVDPAQYIAPSESN
jgi:hypothetical protein